MRLILVLSWSFFILIIFSNNIYCSSDSNVIFVDKENVAGLVEYANIYVVDEVEGNCWTEINKTKKLLASKFEKAGVEIVDKQMIHYTPKTPAVSVNVVGFREQGICVGAVRFEVLTLPTYARYRGILDNKSKYEVVTEFPAILYRNNVLITNSLNLNEQIAKSIGQMADDFLSRRSSSIDNENVRRGKEEIFYNYKPVIGDIK